MPQVAEGGEDIQPLIENWDAIVQVLETLVNSEITDLQKLQTIDMGVYLSTTGAKLGEQATALAKAFAEQQLPTDEFPGVPVDMVGGLVAGKVATVSRDGDTATIRIEGEDGETEDQELVRVDGKWLPKEMVEGWDEGMAESRAFLTTEMAPGLAAAKADVMPVLQMLDSSLGKILAAEDEQQFQAAVGGLMMNAMGLLGPMMGGGGPGAGDPFGPGAGGPPGGGDPFGGGADPFGG